MSHRCRSRMLRSANGMTAGLLCCWLLASGLFAAEPVSESVVVIRTYHQTKVANGLVTVDDVADVRHGAVALRRRIAQLDLDEINSKLGETTVRKSQIAMRLKLAGIADDTYRLVGPKTTRVQRVDGKLNDQTVLQAARQSLADAWNVKSDALRLRLERPLTEVLHNEVQFDPTSRLEPFLAPDVYPGKLRLTMGVYRDEQLVDTFDVPINVHVEQLVAIARRPLKVGERLSIENVLFQRQRLEGRQAVQTVASEALGQFVQRPLSRSSLINVLDIGPQPPNGTNHGQRRNRTTTGSRIDRAEEAVVVRRGSPVVLVARRGAMRVTIHSAQLVKNARVGETVQVKNLSSSRIVSGRLVSPNEVEVSF